MERISVEGLVATTPRHIITQDGLAITSFRLASSSGRATNWYTITLTGITATNAHDSIHKGDRIMASGTLHIRDWDNGTKSGTSVEIEATSIGHDYSWGTGSFIRTVLVKDDTIEAGKLAQVKLELAELKSKLAELAEEK